MINLKLIFLLFPFLGLSQVQIGSDINGDSENNYFGRSLSLSSDGNIIAIGSPKVDGIDTIDSGQVKIYENINGVLNHLVSFENYNVASGDESGFSVSLSSNGSILAIGSPGTDTNGTNSGLVRIYENQPPDWHYNCYPVYDDEGNYLYDDCHWEYYGGWTQIGQDINGESSGDTSGYSVSLSSDGSIVAIGAPGNTGNGNTSGHVRVYQYQTDNWVQLGIDIDSQSELGSLGHSVSLSSDGNIVAIGAPFNGDISEDIGLVQVYQYQIDNWIQLGQNIYGEAIYDASGYSVSLSSNGSVVAIGAIKNSDNASETGHVRIYHYQTDNWVQLGQDINGETDLDNLGFSVSLSSDGSVVAIGAPNNTDDIIFSGYVRIYQYQTDNWVQLGIDIDGESEYDHFGYSVNLSSDGNTVVISAPDNDTNGVNSGQVRVYDLSHVLNSNNFNLLQFGLYPNPAQNQITIQLQEGIELNKVTIYNTLGQFISTSKDKTINTSHLSPSMYLIEIETNQGKATKQLVIE